MPEVVSCIAKQNDAKPLPVKTYQLFPHGSLFFPPMLEDMRNAKHFIHHLYFIWEQDELTAEMTKIMLQKLKEGVEVRIIYDWLGSSTYKKDELKQLEAAGAGVIADFKRLNSRELPQPPQDHRHRLRDRLHRRLQRGPGVHRRRQGLPGVARHRHAHHGSRRCRARRSGSRRGGSPTPKKTS